MTEDISVMTEIPFGRHETLPFPHVTGYWVNRLAAAFRTEVDRELRDLDLTRRQVGMLHFIHRAGRVTASELTRSIGVDSTAVTRMIDRLEDKGLVSRSKDPDDGRRHLIALPAAASTGDCNCRLAKTTRLTSSTNAAKATSTKKNTANHATTAPRRRGRRPENSD